MANNLKSPSSFQLSQRAKREIGNTWKRYKKALNEFKLSEALIAIWELIGFCDRYIERERPWEKSKKQPAVIYNLLFALANIASLLQPFLPEASEKIFRQLGIKPTDKKWHFQIKKGKPLFPRI